MVRYKHEVSSPRVSLDERVLLCIDIYRRMGYHLTARVATNNRIKAMIRSFHKIPIARDGEKRTADDTKNDERVAALHDSYRTKRESGDLNPLNTMEMALLPHLESEFLLTAAEEEMKAQLEDLGKTLPTVQFVNAIPGLTPGTLARIVAMARDLNGWNTIAGLWNRLGVGTREGRRRQGDVDKNLPKDEKNLVYKEHGYSRVRRTGLAVAFTGFPMNIRKTVYYPLFTQQYRETLTEFILHPEKYQHLKTHATMQGCSGHARARAMRYVIKRVLLDIWRHWRFETKRDAELRTAPELPTQVEVTFVAALPKPKPGKTPDPYVRAMPNKSKAPHPDLLPKEYQPKRRAKTAA